MPLRLNTHQLMWLVGLFALIVVFLLSLRFGSITFSLSEVLTGLLSFGDEQMEMTSRILVDLRLPRALMAIIGGAGLAMVGALLQTATDRKSVV